MQKQLQIIQHRQALAMMGLTVWVDKNTPTQTYDNDLFERTISDLKTTNSGSDSRVESLVTKRQTSQHLKHNVTPQSKLDTTQSVSVTGQSPVKQDPPDNATSDHAPALSQDLISTPTVCETVSNETVIGQLNDKNNHLKSISRPINYDIVPAFELLGARYKAWVLMVDTAVFNSAQVANLWQNIVQTLSLSVHDLSFPLCDGMQQPSIANACLSGFIFNIAGREDTQVAMLSDVPVGLDDERLVRVPHLSEMLIDGRLKKQLWQLIC